MVDKSSSESTDKTQPLDRPQLKIDPACLKGVIVRLATEGHLSGDLATALLDFLGLQDA